MTKQTLRMKPETIKRRAKERVKANEERKESLIRKLKEKVKIHGPESIWAEMLKEHLKTK